VRSVERSKVSVRDGFNMPLFGVGTAITQYSISPVELGKWLETQGFESVWFGEHSHLPTIRQSNRRTSGEVTESFKHFFDPYISLTAIAAVTTSLKLGTSISLLTERHPISLSKIISTLDHVSKGRVIIGVGAGWNAEEIADYGIDFKNRWKWVRECVLAMRQIWTHEVAEFHGEMVKFGPMWSWPKPMQPGGPPILLGAFSQYVPARIAEYCDGWLPVDQGETTECLLLDVREAFSRCGRPLSELNLSIILNSSVTDKAFSTSDDQLCQRIRELEKLGFTRMNFVLPSAIPEQQWPELERFARIAKQFR
jgi:probable F420-dependent oxidoreductase